MSHIKSSQLFFILFPICIFILFSSLIVFSWFREGLYYGGAEVGVGPYYNPSRFLEIQKFIWWDSTAPGALVPQFIAGVPLYFILSLLENIFSPLILQAAIFFCLLFMMGFGMYLFSLSFLGKDKTTYAFLAGLFYMFNSYMMVAVWHRFLYTGFFLGASLPILALFWKLWIDKGRFIFLTLFLLINLVFVYMYANLTSTVVVWLLCFLLAITRVIFPWRGKKNCLNTSFKFLLGLSLFLLTNLWWLIPVFKVSTGVLSQQHSIEEDVGTLVNISKQTILPFTLQLANPFYLFYTQELGSIYTNFIFQILPWLPAVVISIGILASLKKRIFASFGFFYLVAILIAKGAANPFGYPYIWGFMNIFALGVIRNPFEKLGILLPFFGSILFIVGLEVLFLYSSKRFGKAISQFIVFTILVTIVIYAFPMFTGRVFNKHEYTLNVKVPETYQAADNWFRNQKNLQGNILHLPFPDKDVVTYTWQNGYHGVEINEILFTALPSITRNVGIKRVDDTLKSLSFIFNKSFFNKDQILNVLQSLNVQYIVLHKETKWDDASTYGKEININKPTELEKNLNNFDFLQKVATFGDLVIYQLMESFYQPKIILSEAGQLVYPGETSIIKIISTVDKKTQIITPLKEDFPSYLLSNITETYLFPQSTLDFSTASESALINIANSMIINPKDSDLTWLQLKNMENTFSQTGELSSEEFARELSLANENIVKIFNATSGSVESYLSLVKKIFVEDLKTSNFFKQFRTQLSNIFFLHLYILDQVSKQRLNEQAKIMEIRNILTANLKSYNLSPLYLETYFPIKEGINRKFLQIKVPSKAKYEILLPYPYSHDLYPNLLSRLDLRINDKSVATSGKIENNNISFGEIDFDEGNYEFSYNLLLSPNLIPTLDKFLKGGQVEFQGLDTMYLNSNKGGVAFLESPIKTITGGDVIKVGMEVLFKSGNYLYLEVIPDTEDFDNVKEYQTIKSGECAIHNCYLIKLNAPYNVWQKYTFQIPTLNLVTQKANLRILAVSENQNSNQIYTEVLVKNLELNRVYSEDVVLKGKFSESKNMIKKIKIDSHNAVKYSGKIKIDKPAFLLFKETFNPDWIFKLSSGGRTYKIDNHYLGDFFGNSYFIDKTGEFNFTLEFEPQKYVDYGITLSIVGWVGVLVTLVYSEFRSKYEN